ncbi:MAG: DUF1345 domain-containing protein [Microbacterium sp.]
MIVHATPVARLLVGAFVGVVVGVLLGWRFGAPSGLVGGWGAGALVTVVWILVVCWPMDAERTREHATREDPGRVVARLIAILGSIASLGAVALVLLQSGRAERPESFLLAAIAVVSVVGSWALIQTDYMLRYARLYYAGDEPGGISFNGRPDAPMYTDFIYFSVGLGMTYQVADTNVSTNELRRVVIAQTMLAYLFGAVILATVVNLVAGLA